MTAKRHLRSLLETERQVLRALGQGAPGSRNPNALRGYRWAEPVHQAIFDFLVDLPDVDPELIREQLPARLTRRGFPDFDLTWFRPHALARKELERLIGRLRDQR